MIPIKSRQIIFTTLFLLNFLFYAMSPLSSTFPGTNDSENSFAPGRTSSVSENIRIWLWELIFTKFSLKEGTSHSPSTVRIFMRKARAIVPDDTLKKGIPLEGNGLIPINIFSRPFDLSSNVTSFVALVENLKGFSSLYSGLSPPFA